MAFTESEKGMAKRILKYHCSKWDEFRYDEIHNKPYFIGKKNKDSSAEIIFPIDCYKKMTFDELKTSITDSGSNSVNLAIYNPDSTVVFYKAELGLKPPCNLEVKETLTADDHTDDEKCSESIYETKRVSVPDEFVTSALNEGIETASADDCLQIDLNSEDSNLDDDKCEAISD